MAVQRRTEWDLMAQPAAIGLAVVGFGFTYAVLTVGSGDSVSERYTETSEFTVWLLLSGVQTAFWCLIALPLWQWSLSLRSAIPAGRPRHLALASAVTWIVLIVLPIIAFSGREGTRSPLAGSVLRSSLLYGLGLLVAAPAVLGFASVRVAARYQSWRDLPQHSAIAQYRYLRDRLRGFLTILGGMVTFSVIVAAARYQAENAFNEKYRPGVGSTPTEVLLMLGALFVGVLTLLYMPVRAALHQLGDDLLDRHCPIPPVEDDEFLPGLERRRQFATLLDLGPSARADLESAILVLSPLLGGIFATFLDTST